LRFVRALAWIAVLSLALLASLFLLPRLVDWQPYKPRLAAYLAEATGRAVSLDGPLAFDLLPQPAISVRDIGLGNAAGARAPNMLEVRRLAATLSWKALLQGRIEVVRIVLDEPRLILEPSADGKPNWWIPTLEPSTGERSSALSLTVDRLEIRNGRLVHAYGLVGQPVEANAINMTAMFDAGQGDLRAQGSAVVNGIPTSLALGVRLEASTEPPVNLAIGVPGGRLTFRGWLGDRSRVDPLRGHVAMDAAFFPEFVESISLLLGRPSIRLNGAILRKVDASGDVELIEDRLSIGGFAFRTEDEEIRGTLQISGGDGIAVSGRLSAHDLDADRWVERLQSQSLLAPTEGRPGNVSVADTPSLRLQLTVEVGSVRYRRDTVRDLTVTFRFDDEAFHVQELKAILPGDFRINRRVGFEGDITHPGYDGIIEVDGRNLRQTLKWIGIDIAAVPSTRLQTFRLAGKTRPVKGVIHVSNASFELDDQSGTATADVALSIPTVITARIHLPRLDLDAYRLSSEALHGIMPSTPAAAERGDISPPLIDIDATLDQVIYRGEPAHQVNAHVAVRGNLLTLKHVGVGALLGSHLEISGSVSDFGTMPHFDLTYRGVLPDADRILDYAGLPRFIHGRIGAAQLAGRVAGSLREATLSNFSVAMLDATITAAGQLTFGDNLRFDFPHWSLSTREIGVLAAAASNSPRLALGEALVHGAFRGDAHHASFRGDITLDGMTLSGEVSSTLAARPRVAVSLRAPAEFQLDRWLPAAPGPGAAHATRSWASQPSSDSSSGGLAALRALDGTLSLTTPALRWGPYTLAGLELSAHLHGGILKVDRLSGVLEGAVLDLTGAVDARQGRTALEVRGSLRDIDISRTIAVAHTANDFGSDDLAVALEGQLRLDDLMLRAEGETLEDLLLSAVGSARTGGRVRPVVSRGSLSMASFATGLGSLFSTELGFASAVIDGFVGRWIATSGAIDVADGVVTLREHTLRGPAATAYITSQIDARRGHLDTMIELDTGTPGSIDYSMSLRGPWLSPTLKVEPNRSR